MADKAAKDEGKQTGSMKTMLLIVVGALLLVAVTGGVTMYVMSGKSDGGDAQQALAEQEEQPESPPTYLALEPAMVVNFQNPGRARYLQVAVEVMARDEGALEAVKQHMPAIRNNLVMLFSSQRSDDLKTREGKEALRAQVLEEVQKILEKHTGKPGVEQVYFTSFVMQ